MAHQVRIEKYTDFNPEPSKWRNDRRIYDTATESLQVLVAKNYSTMALPCAAIYPEMDITKGTFLGFKVAAPDGPLKHYFEQDDTKKILVRAALCRRFRRNSRRPLFLVLIFLFLFLFLVFLVFEVPLLKIL